MKSSLQGRRDDWGAQSNYKKLRPAIAMGSGACPQENVSTIKRESKKLADFSQKYSETNQKKLD